MSKAEFLRILDATNEKLTGAGAGLPKLLDRYGGEKLVATTASIYATAVLDTEPADTSEATMMTDLMTLWVHGLMFGHALAKAEANGG